MAVAIERAIDRGGVSADRDEERLIDLLSSPFSNAKSSPVSASSQIWRTGLSIPCSGGQTTLGDAHRRLSRDWDKSWRETAERQPLSVARLRGPTRALRMSTTLREVSPT